MLSVPDGADCFMRLSGSTGQKFGEIYDYGYEASCYSRGRASRLAGIRPNCRAGIVRPPCGRLPQALPTAASGFGAIGPKLRVLLQQPRKRLYVTFQVRMPKPVVVELAHFRDCLGDWFMFDRNAVSGNHDSCAICAAPAMDKYLGLRIGANQIEKFDNLGRGGIVARVPGNANVLDFKRLKLALLGHDFPVIIPKIDDRAHTHCFQRSESIRSRLGSAIKSICNPTEIG